MSIDCFGGEMGFFTPSDSSVFEYTGNVATGVRGYDSTFSRCDVEGNGSGSYVLGPVCTGRTDGWVHFKLAHEPYASGTTGPFALQDAFSVDAIRMQYNRASQLLTLQYWNGSAYVTVGSITLDLSITGHDIDLHYLVNSASGALNLYVAGTLRISGSGLGLAGTASIIRCISYGTQFGPHISQVAMANETTIGMRVGTVAMTGQGATHTFDVGGYANIDEVAYSDADFIQSGTAAQVELFTGTPVPSFTGYTIRALALTARANYSGSAPTKFRFVLRSAGVNYTSADQTLDFGYGAFCKVWETNPATSAAFQSSEISALQYGVESRT